VYFPARAALDTIDETSNEFNFLMKFFMPDRVVFANFITFTQVNTDSDILRIRVFAVKKSSKIWGKVR
jgi:hypothetical protein